MATDISNLNSRIAAYKCLALSPRQYVVGYSGDVPQFVNSNQQFRCVSFLSSTIKSFGHAVGNISSSAVGTYCQTLSPKEHFIGYESGVPQFITGRQIFRCVDFLPAKIRATTSSYKDLLASVKGRVSTYADLPTSITSSKIIHSTQKDLSGLISGFETLLGSLSGNIVGSYCQTLTPEKHVVGYESGVPQFITGRQWLRCVSFLSANINQIYFADLGASLEVVRLYKEIRNLPAIINGLLKQEEYNLRATIKAWYRENYSDFSAELNIVFPKDLFGQIRALKYFDLGAQLNTVPGKDLSAFLKVWPQRNLPGRIHGWEQRDLTAQIDWNIAKDLPSYIGGHMWQNLTARLKGWVRVATKDLSAYINMIHYSDLPGYIRARPIKDLSAYIFSIAPSDITSSIHGWEERFLPALINGVYSPYDLHGSIVGYRPVDLPASITASGWILPYQGNLQGIISAWKTRDITAYIKTIQPVDLGASIVVVGGTGNLSAFIYPKMIYMTTNISVETMEHKDLSVVINYICQASGFKNLSSYIRCTYLSDLPVYITGKKYPAYSSNLGATLGYADRIIKIDRLPITVNIGSGYLVEDKLPIYLKIYEQYGRLSANITGTPMYSNLGARIYCTWLQEYVFDNIKNREIVYDINHARQINWYEIVEIMFESIVDDYFYVDAEQKVYKTDKLLRWVLGIRSFVPENVTLNIRRKLHRARQLYDLSKYDTMDEAIRDVIDYVTTYNYGDLLCSIASRGGYSNLPVFIKPKYFTTTSSNLTSNVSAVSRKYAVGFSDNGIDVF